MSQYLKISYPRLKPSSGGLKMSITYIGKHYGKLANKEGYKSRKYFKYGKKFIAKRFGSFCETAIHLMAEPKRIKNSDKKQWCYNKRIYVKAYDYIIELLFKRRFSDGVYVKELLNSLYQDACRDSNTELEHLCSNALLFWQKEMLDLCQFSANFSIDREDAGKILRGISEVDKPLP